MMDDIKSLFNVGIFGTTAIGLIIFSWYIIWPKQSEPDKRHHQNTVQPLKNRCLDRNYANFDTAGHDSFAKFTPTTTVINNLCDEIKCVDNITNNEHSCCFVDTGTQIVQNLNYFHSIHSAPSAECSTFAAEHQSIMEKINRTSFMTEKLKSLENKLSVVENMLIKTSQHTKICELNNERIISDLDEIKKCVIVHNNYCNDDTFSAVETCKPNCGDNLSETKLRLSILEDEFQKIQQMNALFVKPSVIEKNLQRSIKAEMIGERTENTLTTIEPPPPPPRPPTPVSSSLTRQKVATPLKSMSETCYNNNYNRMKISVEELRNVKLRPLLIPNKL